MIDRIGVLGSKESGFQQNNNMENPNPLSEHGDSQEGRRTVEVDGLEVDLRADVRLPAYREKVQNVELKSEIVDWGIEYIQSSVRLRPMSNEQILKDSVPVFAPMSTNTIGFNHNVNLSDAPIKTIDLYRRARKEFGDRTFNFSGQVFGSNATTSEVYEKSIQRFVFETTEGVNTCVLGFGDLNSGKTHLMIGSLSQPGIITQAISDLFAHVESYCNPTDNVFSNTIHPSSSRSLVMSTFNNMTTNEQKGCSALRLHFIIRFAYIDIGIDGCARDISAMLFDAESPEAATTLNGGVDPFPTLHVAENPSGSPFGTTFNIEDLNWTTTPTLDMALSLFIKLIQFRHAGYAVPNQRPSSHPVGDLLVWMRVERVVVELKHPRKVTQSTPLSSFYVRERTEGSLCFLLPSKQPNATSNVQSGMYWLRNLLNILSVNEGNEEAEEAAKLSTVTQVLFPYFFNHGRVVLICPLNPGVDLVHQTVDYIQVSSAASKIQQHVKTLHSVWSQYSYYCTHIWDPIKRLDLQIRQLKAAKGECKKEIEQLGQLILALMTRVAPAGSQKWSMLANRRLIPLQYWYSGGNLVDIGDPVGDISLHMIERKEASVQGEKVEGNEIPSGKETGVRTLIFKELRRLREGQADLERKLVRRDKRRQKEKKKSQDASIRTNLERGLSLPNVPEGIPEYVRPKPLQQDKARLSEPRYPDINFEKLSQDSGSTTSSESTSNASPPLIQSSAVSVPKHQKLVDRGRASMKCIPWQSGQEHISRVSQQGGYPWGPSQEREPLMRSFVGESPNSAPERTSSTLMLPENKIKYYLEELLGQYEHVDKESSLESSTDDRRKKKLRGRENESSTETDETHRKSGKDLKHTKARRRKERTTNRKKRVQSSGDSTPSSSGVKSALMERGKRKEKHIPTIRASGGLRVDAENRTGNVHGQRMEAERSQGLGEGSSQIGPMGGIGMMGQVGTGGGYPFGSIGYMPQGIPPGSVPLKPTLEHHMSPAALPPFATFKYPEPQKEPKPIVVHLHQHGKIFGTPETTKKEITLNIEEKTDERTTEAQRVGIATAATLRNLVEKEEAEKRKEEIEKITEEAEKKRKEYLAPPFRQAPSGVMPWDGLQLGFIPLSQPHPPSPTNFKLGFEGALNVDPAFFKHRGDLSSSTSSSSSHSTRNRRKLPRGKKLPEGREQRREKTKRRVKNLRERSRGSYDHERESSDTLGKKNKKKTFSQKLREERHNLIRKLLQQLYYYPDASGAAADRTLQDVLPLLQPFERDNLLKTIEEYRTSMGLEKKQMPERRTLESLQHGTYVIPSKYSIGRTKAQKASERKMQMERYDVPLSHLDKESTPTISELDTDELIERIRSVDRVSRKHRRAILRGETGGHRQRVEALKAGEVHKQLRRMETAELLKQLKSRSEKELDSEIFKYEETSVDSQRDNISLNETAKRKNAQRLQDEMGSARLLRSPKASVLLSSEELGEDQPQVLKEISRKQGEPARPPGLENSVLSQNTLESSKASSQIIEPSWTQMDTDEPNVAATLHQKAMHLQNDIADLVKSLRVDAPKISVTDFSDPVPAIQIRTTQPEEEEEFQRKIRKKSLLMLPTPQHGPPPRKGVNLARTTPEKPLKMGLVGAATVEGDASVVSQMRGVMGLDSRTQPAIAAVIGTGTGGSFPLSPVAIGCPQGGEVYNKNGQFGGPSVMTNTDEQDENLMYIAEICVPEEEQEKKTEIPETFLPPPRRRQMKPDAGSPLPLSSLLWGGAEANAEKLAAQSVNYPTTTPIFSHIVQHRDNGAGPTKDRYEVPIADWERVGMLAGAEDSSEEQVAWQLSLRPWLDESWRTRVKNNFSTMMDRVEKLQEEKEIDVNVVRSTRDRESQINKILRAHRDVLKFEKEEPISLESFPSRFQTEGSQLEQFIEKKDQQSCEHVSKSSTTSGLCRLPSQENQQLKEARAAGEQKSVATLGISSHPHTPSQGSAKFSTGVMFEEINSLQSSSSVPCQLSPKTFSRSESLKDYEDGLERSQKFSTLPLHNTVPSVASSRCVSPFNSPKRQLSLSEVQPSEPIVPNKCARRNKNSELETSMMQAVPIRHLINNEKVEATMGFSFPTSEETTSVLQANRKSGRNSEMPEIRSSTSLPAELAHSHLSAEGTVLKSFSDDSLDQISKTKADHSNKKVEAVPVHTVATKNGQQEDCISKNIKPLKCAIQAFGSVVPCDWAVATHLSNMAVLSGPQRSPVAISHEFNSTLHHHQHVVANLKSAGVRMQESIDPTATLRDEKRPSQQPVSATRGITTEARAVVCPTTASARVTPNVRQPLVIPSTYPIAPDNLVRRLETPVPIPFGNCNVVFTPSVKRNRRRAGNSPTPGPFQRRLKRQSEEKSTTSLKNPDTIWNNTKPQSVKTTERVVNSWPAGGLPSSSVFRNRVKRRALTFKGRRLT